jgi:hypothetical protein
MAGPMDPGPSRLGLKRKKETANTPEGPPALPWRENVAWRSKAEYSMDAKTRHTSHLCEALENHVGKPGLQGGGRENTAQLFVSG